MKGQKEATDILLLLIASKQFENLHVWSTHLVVWPSQVSETEIIA